MCFGDCSTKSWFYKKYISVILILEVLRKYFILTYAYFQTMKVRTINKRLNNLLINYESTIIGRFNIAC